MVVFLLAIVVVLVSGLGQLFAGALLDLAQVDHVFMADSANNKKHFKGLKRAVNLLKNYTKL